VAAPDTGTVTSGSVNVASTTLTMPAGAGVGDIAILHIVRNAAEAAPTVSAASGTAWAQVATTDTTTSQSQTVWWRKVATGEAGSLVTTITLAISPTAGKFTARIRTIAGLASSPIGATNVTLVASSNVSTTRTSPTITTTAANSIILELFGEKTTSVDSLSSSPAATGNILSDFNAAASSQSAFSGEDTGTYASGVTAGGRNWVTAQAQQGTYRTLELLVASGGLSTGATLAETVTLTSTGAVGFAGPSTAVAATVTLAATGTVTSGVIGGGTLATTITSTAAGSTTTSAGATRAQTVTLTAAGAVTSVAYLDVGGPVSDGFIVKAKGSGFTSLSLNVSTSSSMTSPTAFGPVTADGDGFYRFAATGLSAFTQYYYQLTDSVAGPTGPISAVSTAPTPGTPTSFDVTLGACVRSSSTNGVALANATARNARLNIFTGDQSYAGSTSTTVTVHEAQVLNQLAAVPSYQAFWRNSAKLLTLSDHDAGPDNGPSNLTDAPYQQASIDAYNHYSAYQSLADTRSPTVGRYYSVVYGTVKFIVIDIRNTDRSTVTVTGTTSDTMLGATQLAWLKAELITSEKFKVIIGDTQLTGPNDNPGAVPVKGDWWPAYPVERDAIFATYIPANNCGHVEYWHGDSHLIGYATAAKNAALGGVPSICAAGYDQDGGGRATSSFSAFWNNTSGAVLEYGYNQFTCGTGYVRRTFTGYDSSSGTDVARVTDTLIAADTALAATVTLTASGSVSAATSSAATLAETVTTTSAGTVGKTTGSAAAETVTLTTTGTVGETTGAALPTTVTTLGAGTVAASTAAALPTTVTGTSSGVVARSTGSALATTITLTSSGTVTSGLISGSTLTTTVTTTSTGLRAAASGSTLPATVTLAAAGTVNQATGATQPVTVALTTTGTTGTAGGSLTLTGSGSTGASTGSGTGVTVGLVAAGVVVSGKATSAALAVTIATTAAGTVVGSAARDITTTVTTGTDRWTVTTSTDDWAIATSTDDWSVTTTGGI
jgi:phosphodiesterase/alkaline phosphatase D-like protein